MNSNSTSLPFDVNTWPTSPERDKPLYINTTASEEDRRILKERGWDVIDVRLMPNGNDHERGEAWRAYMEGVRIGTINPDPKLYKFLELEGKALKQLTGKDLPEPKKKKLQTEDLDAVLTLNSELAFTSAILSKEQVDKQIKQVVSAPGRKRGAKNLKPKDH